MYFYRKNECINCNDCINDPCDVSCNTACNPKVKPYITLQPYEHLFNLNDAFYAGTIFKDLYSPYCDVKYVKEVK